MKNNLMKFIALIIGCGIIITIIVLIFPKEQRIGSEKELTQQTTINENKNIEELETVKEEAVITIDTPYCPLYYPKIWEKNLLIEDLKSDTYYGKTFYFVLEETKLEMFSVYFGSEDKGTTLGYLKDNGKRVSFSVEVTEHEVDEGWSKENKALLQSMTDGVNDIIVSVTKLENFEQ